MKRLLPALILGLACQVQADQSGNIAAEFSYFPDTAVDPRQLDSNLTVSAKPKWEALLNNGDDLLSLELFFRLDDKDRERQHFDIRQLRWLHVSGDDEWRVGIDTVFWGVTESQHLVDVINQVDALEGIDGEDKLGQPMLHYTAIRDWGIVDAFLLTGFRPVSTAGMEGRLRLPLPVKHNRALYESSAGDQHIDFALRYSHTLGDSDIGLSLFNGTRRDPVYQQDTDRLGNTVLVPYYLQMTQLGLDLQSIIGDWTWKLEAIYRDQRDLDYSAMTAGFEYTLYGIFESAIDVGTLLEYSADDLPDNTSLFNHDLFAGLRFVFNDVQSTEVLSGLLWDHENNSKSIRVEANRRIGSNWKITAELQWFASVDDLDPLHSYAEDSYLLLELARYY